MFPLKSFVKCGHCGKNWTAYSNKKKHRNYYKCNTPGCKCNRSSDLMHNDFKTYLQQFHLHGCLIGPLTFQLKLTFRNLNESYFIQKLNIEKRRKELLNDLNIINHRFAIGKIDNEVYMAGKEIISNQIIALDKEFKIVDVKISNPDKFVEFALKVSQNLDKIWDSGTAFIKRAIQKLIFPTGVFFDKRKMEYRTTNINRLFASMAELAKVIEGKRNEISYGNANLSALVDLNRDGSNFLINDLWLFFK